MPNRAADIMRMMQGIHGAGGANQPVSPYGPAGELTQPPVYRPRRVSNLGQDLSEFLSPPPPNIRANQPVSPYGPAGAMGARGANQPVSPYGPAGAMGAPPSPAGRFAEDMDPEELRRLMEMMNRAVGKPAPDTSTLRRGPDTSTLRRG